MDRREFVKFLALTAAGAAAMPEQIAAFERYYEVNTPVGEDLLAVDEVFVSGMANKSMPTEIDIRCGGEVRLPLGVNLFGGIVRWVASPDAKLMVPAREFAWRISSNTPGFSEKDFRGHISYLDQSAQRHCKQLTTLKGRLG